MSVRKLIFTRPYVDHVIYLPLPRIERTNKFSPYKTNHWNR